MESRIKRVIGPAGYLATLSLMLGNTKCQLSKLKKTFSKTLLTNFDTSQILSPFPPFRIIYYFNGYIF